MIRFRVSFRQACKSFSGLVGCGPGLGEEGDAGGGRVAAYEPITANWRCSAWSSRSQMNPTRSLLIIALHHATISPAADRTS